VTAAVVNVSSAATDVSAPPAPAGDGRVVGTSQLRKEDHALLTGRAWFVDDLRRPGMVHAAVLRSPHARARIGAIDAAPARGMRGVLDVITHDDLPDGLRIPMRMFRRPGMERFLQPPLADGAVRYVGEPVAVVVADSRYVAEDAAELVEVHYEPLPAVVDGLHAADADPLHAPAADTNVAADFVVEHGDVDAAFAAADVVVEQRIRCQRHAAVPMETRGLVAEWDVTGGSLTVWGASKIVHINRRILASLLGLPEERVRLVELAVGGGFGARGEFYPEDYLIPFCAIRLGRAVSWTEDRAEHLASTNHSRDQIHDIAIALRADGTFLALRDSLVNDTGAYVRTHGTVVPGMTAGLLPGPYGWPALRCHVRQVVTNKTPAGTYRAPGRYEANLARERIIDIAAHRMGLDPVELRRRNLVKPDAFPYATGTHTDGHGVVYDSGDYPRLLDRAVEAFDRERMARWREEAPAGRRRGLGYAYFVEKSGIAHWEYARVGLAADGSVDVHVGSASVGQGLDTVLAQICADHLSVGYDDVSVHHGDTATVPDGMGAFGSRATMLGGSAVADAAGRLRGRLLALAAERLEASPDDLEVRSGRVVVRGSESRNVTFAVLAEAQRPLAALTAGRAPGLAEEAYFYTPDMSFPYGMHCVAVEIDERTGAVDVIRYLVTYDVGRAINPMLIEGQIAGGAAQGMGGALLEELAYDEGGQLVAASFLDYLLPTAADTPPVESVVTEDAPTPLSPLGAKGAGEGGTAAAGAAIANAVSDALGAEADALPLTPARVVALARADRRAG
jgi:CO/xanthine dehydrogenase Mo-binding subunit